MATIRKKLLLPESTRSIASPRLPIMSKLSRYATLILAGVWLAMTPASIWAQSYPTKPVRWILGFPSGGTSDILVRVVGSKLSESWGQQVVADNKPGASGIIANELASKASPDGYTMLLVSSTYANLISMGKKLPYDPDHDLVPVMRLASVPNALSVHPSVPVRSVKDLIGLAKSRPGQINYATGGTLTGPHLGTELFRLMTGVNIVHVPYKGTPPAVTDLIAGRVEVMFALMPVVIPHLQSGRLRGIAVSGSKRVTELPNLPTVAETLPGYEATTWFGLLVPHGTSPAIINRLHQEIGRIVGMPNVVETLAGVGYQITTSTPDEFATFMKSEVDKWRKVIQEARIPVT